MKSTKLILAQLDAIEDDLNQAQTTEPQLRDALLVLVDIVRELAKKGEEE